MSIPSFMDSQNTLSMLCSSRRVSLATFFLLFFILNAHTQNVGINTAAPEHPFQVNVDSSFAVTMSDQSATSPNSFLTIASGQGAAQRVICGLSGELSQVDLMLNHTGTSGTMSLTIRQGGMPGGAVLIQQDVEVTDAGATNYHVIFSGPLPALESGDSIFLELTYVSGGNVQWSKNSTNPYTPGIAYLYTGSWTMLPGDDMIFETHVSQQNSLSIPILKVTAAGRISIKNYTLPESDGANGEVMVTDGNGEIAWSGTDSFGLWNTKGNAGIDSMDFLGTLDNQPLRFKLNNQNAGVWDGANSNYSMGVGALDSLTAGTGNIAIGTRALFRNTIKSGLVAVGDSALFLNGLNDTTWYHAAGNTALGSKSLYSNTSGFRNTASGYQSLYSNTIGAYNTVSGYEALYSNTSGFYNTACGYKSSHSNTTGNRNAANGYQSLYFNTTGNNNTANGASALYSNTLGEHNTANGYTSLYSNISGNFNTANGGIVLFSNTIGQLNTACGYGAMYYNTSGNRNTACGYGSLWGNTSGDWNTASGYQSLHLNSTGDRNTASGYESLKQNTTGYYNTAVGYRTLYSNTTGYNNTALGYYSDVLAGSTHNATALGYNTYADATNKVRIGDANVTSNGGQVSWTTYSDARIKDDIQMDVPGLRFIQDLRPVTYHFNSEMQNQIMGIVDTVDWPGKRDIEAMKFSGFLAQEVEAVAKSIGYEFSGVDKSGKIMGLRYAEFTVPLVKAVQELADRAGGQQTIIETQQAMLNKQQAEIEEFKSVLAENSVLKDQLEKITAALESMGIVVER